MPQLLLLHVMNEDPVVVETDRIPEATDTCVVGMHPRRKDNKEVHYIQADVTTVIFPMNRINFIEVLPSADEEEVFKPFRE